MCVGAGRGGRVRGPGARVQHQVCVWGAGAGGWEAHTGALASPADPKPRKEPAALGEGIISHMAIQPPKRFQLTELKWPSAKSPQTINAEGVLENSVPPSSGGI